MERIARNAVALRITDNDRVELLWQPLFAEITVAKVCVNICYGQNDFVGIIRLVGNIILYQ